MLATAKAILERGGCVLIFPEGTRIRPGALGRPKRGVGRLALETGAPVVPVAVIGTEAVRNGWRIRPHKVRVRIGRPLTFPKVEKASPQLAAAVTDRIWPNVMLQWEWLGRPAPAPARRRRRRRLVGHERGRHARPRRPGGRPRTRTQEQAERIEAERANERYLPASGSRRRSVRCGRPSWSSRVTTSSASRCRPPPYPPLWPRTPAGSPRAAGCSCVQGLVPPLGTLPAAYVAERVASWAVGAVGGPAHPKAALEEGASLVLATQDAAFARQVADALSAARFDVVTTTDLIGVELAGSATSAAALAAAAAGSGLNAAGAAAGKVFAEVEAYGAPRGCGQPETFAGLAGTGDLVAPGASRRGRATGAPGSCWPRGSRATSSSPYSAKAPRRSARCRCSTRACDDAGVDAPCPAIARRA